MLIEAHPCYRLKDGLGAPIAEVDDVLRPAGPGPVRVRRLHGNQLAPGRVPVMESRVGDDDSLDERDGPGQIDDGPGYGGDLDAMGRGPVSWRNLRDMEAGTDSP